MQETLSHFQVKQHIIKFGVQGDNHAICLVFVAKKKKKTRFTHFCYKFIAIDDTTIESFHILQLF